MSNFMLSQVNSGVLALRSIRRCRFGVPEVAARLQDVSVGLSLRCFTSCFGHIKKKNKKKNAGLF